jgi:hypothetical protein
MEDFDEYHKQFSKRLIQEHIKQREPIYVCLKCSSYTCLLENNNCFNFFCLTCNDYKREDQLRKIIIFNEDDEKSTKTNIPKS